ncbi:uncharacterized protein LOC132737912 [Ruditapes philippinarum]|uniref:uncharacterized protein LOC132737912 n=1 Tax=Ruditapes philippinarum TaxID=129788 RepID=UPI00295B609E|nr:uncharacterized protein LOC132737912 [Ruditapes philippinarum]
MTNEINLRTNKSEYNAGDDIYGVVYLRINTPTRGRGVRIRFKGYEKFNYEGKRNIENEPPVCYSDHRDYVSLDEILHQSDGPLSMCITYYPFKIKLPMEIPGTFHARHESEELRWDARVEYILEAEVIDASKALATNQKVSVRQSLQRELKAKDAPAAILAKYEDSSFFGLFTSAIDVTARLHDHIHRTGENARLRVIITNNSNVIVQSIKLQLRRSIYLTCPQMTLGVQVQENVGHEQSIDMVRFPKGLKNAIP